MEASSSKATPEETTKKSTNPPPVDNQDQSKGEKKLSKNQLKRQRKREEAAALKRRRKEQEKKIKLAKALAEGRDIEKERQISEENRKLGKGKALRDEKWKKRFEANSSKFKICLDCSFESVMSEKEIGSLASQIRYCYAANKKAKHPVNVTISDLKGTTKKRLEKVDGIDQWKNRAFTLTDTSLLEALSDTEKSKLVYLTSDSDNVLEDLEDGKVYIIGGIVDRNRLKRAAINRAEELGIATAKLPISEYLNMVTTKVLTCNHVFEILLKYREHENDWKKSFLNVLPTRKDATEKKD